MYDLLIEDATIVSSEGRQVADIAIKGGLVVYVGSRPAGRAREKVNAIGKFAIPGLVDVDLRFSAGGKDQPRKWTRSSAAAATGGITTGVLRADGGPPITSRAALDTRRKQVGKRMHINHAFWAGAGQNNLDELNSMLEGGAAGIQVDMGELDGPMHCSPEFLERLFQETSGLLNIQAQDQALLSTARAEHGNAGSPADLFSSAAASAGVENLIRKVRETDRRVLLSRLSTATEFSRLDPYRPDLPITACVLQTALFLSRQMEDEQGVRMKTVPPLREELDRRALWTAMKRGRIDILASGSAPGPQGAVSAATPCWTHPRGIPGAELLFSLMLSAVQHGRLGLERMVSLLSEGPAKFMGLESKGRIAKGLDADIVLFRESATSPVVETGLVSPAGWSPYLGRELAPKPDLVLIAGRKVAEHGVLVAKKPAGVELSIR